MNLEGKIDLIKSSVADIKQAILDKDVTPSGNLSTYADAIDNIVTPNNQSKTITSNGVVRYDEGYTGLEQVTVNVNQSVQDKTITNNGTYTADNGYVGLGTVTVNVTSALSDLIDGSVTIIDTNVSSIRSSAFEDCLLLNKVVLRNNTVVDLSKSDIFKNTPIGKKLSGYIYVPDGLVNNYSIIWGDWDKHQPERNSNLGNKTWRNIVYGNNVFVALDNDGYISTSNNGIDWQEAIQDSNLSKDATTKNWRDFCYYNGNFIALNYNGMISTSTNGKQWSVASQKLRSSYKWVSIASSNYKLMALDLDGNIAYSDDNGGTWTFVSSLNTNLGSNSWISMACDGTEFYILGSHGHLSSSVDGENWNTVVQDSNLSNNNWNSLFYDGNNFIALSSGGYTSLSAHCVNWQIPYLTLGSNSWTGLAKTSEELIAIGTTGYIGVMKYYNIRPISQLPS